MLKVSQLMRVNVHLPKRNSEGDLAKLSDKDLTLVGEVHQVVFSPEGDRVVGLLVRRPDVGGMIRRSDAFLALDSFVVGRFGLVVTRGDESLDDAARQRLQLDWDKCILWVGMDAKTTDGKDLGWVCDVEFFPKSGRVRAFYVGDGSVATSLVGNVVIPADMLRGYGDGYLLVAPEAVGLTLDGGLAAKAGEGYARAKQSGKEVAARAGAAAGDAVEKGAYGVGKALGKAKKAVRKKSSGKSASQVVGKQLKKTRGMFGAFMDEYKKASS